MKLSSLRILMFGNALEYYDFFLCSFFVSIISPSFFPAADPIANLLLGFCFLGVGFIARPFGAVFFGNLGDKYGRKYALMRTLFLMGISTFIIGILPTYDTIGLYAPFSLIILRLLQGFAIGGEVNGSAILGLEISSSHKKGFVGSLLSASAGIGAILATFFGVLFINDFMPTWAWRVLFCLGGSVALIGIYLRRSLQESIPKKIFRFPILEVCKNHTRSLIKTIGVGIFLHFTFFILVGCINPLLHAKGLVNRTEMIFMDGGIVLFGTLLSPLMGLISDKIGQQKLMLIGVLGQMLIALPFFLIYSAGNITAILFASLLLMFFSQAFNAPSNAYLNTLFPTECRYTGVSFGITLGIACAGSTTPYICSQLLQASIWAPSIYTMGVCLFGILAIIDRPRMLRMREPS